MQNQYILRGITKNRNIYLSKYKCISITSMWMYGVHMYLYWLFMFLHDSILFNWCNGLLFSLFLFIVTSFPCLSLFVCFLRNLRNCKSIFIYLVFFSNLFQRPLTVSLVHNEITPPPAAITTTKVSFKENVK